MVSFTTAPVIFVDEYLAGPKALEEAIKKLSMARPVFYKIRYWNFMDNKWAYAHSEFTSKRMARSFAKECFAVDEKASVVAFLLNGQRVFISGTKR